MFQLIDLLKALYAHDCRFVVCGGVACVLQGVERATYDLDVLVVMEPDNLQKVLCTAAGLELVPRIPQPAEQLLDPELRQKWKEDKNALVYTFASHNSPLQLDILLDYPISFDDLMQRADLIDIDGCLIPVSSKEDLLTIKKAIEPPRTKDRIDIEELEALLAEEQQTG